MSNLIVLACQSATTTTTLAVNATVVNTCQALSAPGALSFGSTLTGLTQATGQTTLSFTCTNGDALKIGLDAGTGTGATVTNRIMKNGANLLNYSLYKDASFTNNWGNTVGTDTLSITSTGSNQSVTIYGQTKPGQTPPAGTYSDTVNITVTY